MANVPYQIPGPVTVDTTTQTGVTVQGTTTMGAATLTAQMDAGTHKIVNVVNPSGAQDAATKNYVDGVVGAGGYTTIQSPPGNNLASQVQFSVDGTKLVATNNGGASRTDITAPGCVATAGDTMTGSLAFSVDNSFDIGAAAHALAHIFGRIISAGGNVMTVGYNDQNGLVIGNTIINFQFGGANYFSLNTGAVQPSTDNALGLGTVAFRFKGSYNAGATSGGYTHQTGTTYTVSINDTFVGMANTGARTVTLPLASAMIAGQFIFIKDEAGTAAGANITTNRAGGDTIDGGTSIVLATSQGVTRLYCDGVSKWFSF